MPDASTQPQTRAIGSGIQSSSASGTTIRTSDHHEPDGATPGDEPCRTVLHDLRIEPENRPENPGTEYDNRLVQPPDSLKSLSDPIYEAFYGLKEQPFAISTDPKFLFLSAPHRRAYDELMHGISRDESLMLLTGETGSGKTTLCRAVVSRDGRSHVLVDPAPAVHDRPGDAAPDPARLRHGVERRAAARRAGRRRRAASAWKSSRRSCASLLAVQARAIVVIDEAQSLSPTLLDEVRMLTAFEREGKRLVQIVLCGQPMLLNTLKTEPMYALNERITRRVALTPLSEAEVEAYIYHRLSIAGGADTIGVRAGRAAARSRSCRAACPAA